MTAAAWFVALGVTVTPTGWLVYRHSPHRHGRHRLHRQYPYVDRFHHLYAPPR